MVVIENTLSLYRAKRKSETILRNAEMAQYRTKTGKFKVTLKQQNYIYTQLSQQSVFKEKMSERKFGKAFKTANISTKKALIQIALKGKTNVNVAGRLSDGKTRGEFMKVSGDNLTISKDGKKFTFSHRGSNILAKDVRGNINQRSISKIIGKLTENPGKMTKKQTIKYERKIKRIEKALDTYKFLQSSRTFVTGSISQDIARIQQSMSGYDEYENEIEPDYESWGSKEWAIWWANNSHLLKKNRDEDGNIKWPKKSISNFSDE